MVAVGAGDAPDAVVEGSGEMILGVAAGALPLSVLVVRGDRDATASLFAP